MHPSIRIISTAGAAILASTIFVPAASAAPTSASAPTAIAVCVSGLQGSDADVSVGSRSASLGSGECAVFTGLIGGRTYEVSAVGACGLDDSEVVRAVSGQQRRVQFYGDCSTRSYDRSYDRSHYDYDNRPYRGYRGDRGYRGYRNNNNNGGYRPGRPGGYNPGNPGGYPGGGGNQGNRPPVGPANPQPPCC